jgi:WD40 repeat protein
VLRKLLLTALLGVLALPTSSHATFPGENGKIAFQRSGHIWTMNPDGSDQVDLTSGRAPAWSPDGTKIAFVDAMDVYVMNADGSGRTVVPLGIPNTGVFELGWSPDGTQFVLAACCPPGHDSVLLKANVDGSGSTIIADSLDGFDWPDWSPDGARIAATYIDGCLNDPDILVLGPGGGFLAGAEGCVEDQFELSSSWSPNAQRVVYAVDAINSPPEFGPSGLFVVNRDGTGRQRLTSGEHITPAFSPDGTKIAHSSRSNGISIMNADGTGTTLIATGSDPDWQPIPINAYSRPRGASPLQLSLVPAYEPCTASNRTHGAPLSFPSCTPPDAASAHLTTGTPDANGRPVRMNAALTLKVVTGDVQISTHLNDVANLDLTDYTGTLRAQLPVRITDKFNTPHPGGPGAATTQPFVYGFTISCAANAGTTTGSDCNVATSMNALAPGTHADGRRAVWQLGQVRVFDGGADADGSTTADNTPFAVEGIFIP